MASDEAVSIRNSKQSVVVAIIGGCAAALLVLMAADPGIFYEGSASTAFRVAAALGAIALGLWAARVAGARVLLKPTGVEVRNPLRRYSFTWEEVARFRLGSCSYHPRIGLLDLMNGRTVPMLVVTGSHPVPWSRDRTADDLLADLETYRLSHVGGPGGRG